MNRQFFSRLCGLSTCRYLSKFVVLSMSSLLLFYLFLQNKNDSPAELRNIVNSSFIKFTDGRITGFFSPLAVCVTSSGKTRATAQTGGFQVRYDSIYPSILSEVCCILRNTAIPQVLGSN